MDPTQSEYVRIFEPLERLFNRSGELSRAAPAPGSRADRAGRTNLGKIAWDLAAPANTIGVDHLIAWRQLRLGAGIQPMFSHLTLLRGAIEGTAVTRWLCDPGIGADERIQRAAGVQLADYEQRLRYENRMADRLAKPGGEVRTAAQRIEALKRLLQREHIKPIGMPSATDLFGRYALGSDPENLAGERLYRLISAIPHAKVWSLYGISELGETIDLGGDQYAVKIAANDELGVAVTAVAMRVARQALEDLEWYGGPPA